MTYRNEARTHPPRRPYERFESPVAGHPDVTIYAPQENFGVFGAALPGTFYKRNEALPKHMRYFDGNPPETLSFGSAWPQGKFTWERGFAILKEVFAERYIYAGLGTTLQLGPTITIEAEAGQPETPAILTTLRVTAARERKGLFARCLAAEASPLSIIVRAECRSFGTTQK